MDWSLIPGLVPAVVSLVSAIAGIDVSEDDVRVRLRELQERGLPQFSSEDQLELEEIRDAHLASEPPER